MTSDLMLADTLSVQALACLVREYDPPAPALLMLEEVPQRLVRPKERPGLVRFEVFQTSLALPACSCGRIFHRHGEIRWESGPQSARVVYTGEEQFKIALPQAREKMLSATCQTVERQAFLFGKRLENAARPGDYAEARIPRLLCYPNLRDLDGAQRLKLAFWEYLDRTSGASIAYRFLCLVPFLSEEREVPA